MKCRLGARFDMKMNFNLNLIQTQKLIMTPELKQALEILQYNAVELNEFINEELLNNPVLERVVITADSENEKIENPESHENENDHTSAYDNEIEYTKKENEKEHEPEYDWDDTTLYFDEYKQASSLTVYNTTYSSDQEVNYDNFIAEEETLKDYLLMQL